MHYDITVMDLSWYETLNKPAFTPPANIFTPAWAFLYTTIFISFILFMTKKTECDKTKGIALFLAQLIFNMLWAPVFFYWKNLSLSLVIIVLLIAFLLATIIYFFRISKLAAILLIPYFLWVCFATYLNYGFMIMN